jgi:hypothetical protein
MALGQAIMGLAEQNTLHHKPPEILMDMQIKHLVSGSSFEMSIY